MNGRGTHLATRPPAPHARRRNALAAGLLALLAGACSATPGTTPTNQPPTPAAVRDGMGPDLDALVTGSALFANWDAFADPEGSAVLYEWCIGTAPGRHDVLGWTDVGGATRAATGPEVELPLDRELFVSVRARDLAGLLSRASTSDGIVLGVASEPLTPSLSGGERARPTARASTHQLALERFGVTWTFAGPVISGRFVNGDWWVIGPVEIVRITPQCRVEAGRARNGSMIDPDPASGQQGYDSAMFGEFAADGYAASLNVARDLSAENPLRLEPGCSLVSAVSEPQAGALPQLATCAVLTCLAEAPPADAFRPPYCRGSKACRWRAGALDLTALADLEHIGATPDPRELTARFERTWLDHVPGSLGRFLHPRQNMPDYGRDMADLVGQAALVLQLEGDETAKRALANALVQVGIDNGGLVRAGGRFLADGGSGAGRKFPVMLAGALLADDELLRCARDQKLAFAEDVQTFFVAETAPGEFNHGCGGYGAEDVGLAEWGQRHADDPRLDARAWEADAYRRCCTTNAWAGFTLATRIMGLRDAWGHDALFDYVDRYMQAEERGTWTRCWTPFVERMWDHYRAEF